MPTTKPKRPEIVLATWPNKVGAECFGDRRYPKVFPDESYDSMWLSFRVVDDDSFTAYRMRDAISNIGLWVFWHNDRDDISVEFKAHEVHSANVQELQTIISELQRLQKRVPARLHGQSYADYVFATLQAAGIKRVVEYRGIGVKDQHSPLSSVRRELTDEIVSRSKPANAAA